MNHSVLSVLIPVVLLVAIDFIACRAIWIRAEVTKDLSSLVFVVVTAALPIGINVFLFSQRYAVAEDLVTASVIVSNALALLTLLLVMLVAGRL